MSKHPVSRFYALMPWLLLFGFLGGCFGARGMTEIRYEPYPLIYQDDSLQRYGDRDDYVLIEVRRVTISRPLENLAIHYRSFFPGGEIIRTGDLEEYLKIGDKNAYRVVFRTSYIRRRKTPKSPAETEKVPEGWTLRDALDPLTGKSMSVLYGPVIPREKMLYLVEGKGYLYYIFLRADGDAIESARKKFEEFVTKGIDYK